MTRAKLFLLIFSALAAHGRAPAPATGAVATPPVDQCGDGLDQEGVHKIFAQVGEAKGGTEDQVISKALVDIAQRPPVVAPSKQAAAPAQSGVSASPVNGADLPSILSLAVDNNLVSSDEHAMTVALTPFAFVSLTNPDIVDDQQQYAKYELLRRMGGSLTLGGTGDKLDQDGDGTLDDPLESESLGDIVTWELRYRVVGTRDARDEKWATKFSKRVSAARLARRDALDRLGKMWNDYANDPSTPQPVNDNRGLFCTQAVKRFLATPNTVPLLHEIAGLGADLAGQSTQIQKEIEESNILTFVFGGTQRKDQFGPDKTLIALRGAFGNKDNGYTYNVEYSKIDGLNGAPDPTSYKVGAEWAWLAMKGRVGSGKNSGLRFSASGAWEKYQDVPDATHDDIAKLNVKLEWPLNDYITLPISITWANHTDLLSDEEETRGFIGFTVDTSNLLDSKKN